jgi:hypothetical protein
MEHSVMTWRAKLAERRSEKNSDMPILLTDKTDKTSFVGFVSKQNGHIQKIFYLRNRLLRLCEAMAIDQKLINELPTEDVAACEGLDDDVLRTYVRSLRDSDAMERGRVPEGMTARALCRSCGPVLLSPNVAAVAPVSDGWPRVLGCPWCHVRNRAVIPRPVVRCGECRHFVPDRVSPHSGLGRCGLGRERLPHDNLHYPHAARQCEAFIPAGAA